MIPKFRVGCLTSAEKIAKASYSVRAANFSSIELFISSAVLVCSGTSFGLNRPTVLPSNSSALRRAMALVLPNAMSSSSFDILSSLESACKIC